MLMPSLPYDTVSTQYGTDERAALVDDFLWHYGFQVYNEPGHLLTYRDKPGDRVWFNGTYKTSQ